MIKNAKEELKKLKEQEEKLNKELADLELSADGAGELYKELSAIKKPLEKLTKFFDLEKEARETQNLINDPDHEISSLAKEDWQRIETETREIEKEIEEFYKEKDLGKTNEVIMEIRAGTGGEEAALFAQNLFKMYSRFAEKNSWEIIIISENTTDLGGLKEIVFKIKGKNSRSFLRYESGVHRVQRIPETEKNGRIHTSTASVAVLPIIEESEIKINPPDLKFDFFRSSGPGGQNVNKVETAVRITHIPTGIVVGSQTERSQARNKERAMEILRSKLHQEINLQKKQEVGQLRKEQIGSAERAEKIRTYNFPQDRITDHRIKKNWYNIENIMAGNIEPIVETFESGL